MSARETILWLFLVQASIGAFDTLYFHEWRARLPALGRRASKELRLHWLRSLIYSILFAFLPWWEPQGLWSWAVLGLLVAEIFITLADFVVEDDVRVPRGGVYPGERATHAIMGILHGAVLAFWVPLLWTGQHAATAWIWNPAPGPEWLRWMFPLLSAGVFCSAWRDLYASTGRPGSAWPWRPE